MTDTKRVRLSDPGEPEDCNLFTIHRAVTPEARCDELARDCRAAAIGCIDCKKVLTESLEAELAPVRERYREYTEHPERVSEILAEGARWCRDQAREVIAEARQAMGILA